jgi:catalase
MPTDEQLVATAKEVLQLLHGAFGPNPGYRAAHAKGKMLEGVFTPTTEAAALSKAPHFHAASTPVTVRFSLSTGLPHLEDNDGNANPNGMAVRFNLPAVDGRRQHTDVIGHATPHFPVHDGRGFADFLKAIMASPPGAPSPTPLETFLASHPAAQRFVQAPKPFAQSWGSQSYYALNAFKFVAADGKETFVRYQMRPDVGHLTLSDEEAKAKGPSYLAEEIAARVGKGPVGFKLVAQIAEEGDTTDDITAEWPDSRKIVELGSISIDRVNENNDKDQKYAIMDPVPRVDGIEPSADPILEFRAALYLMGGRERRAA